MKIISWNVNGLRSVIRKGFFSWLEKENPEILCLQEIKIGERELTFDLLYPKGYHAYFNSAKKKGYSGTAVFTKEEPILVNRRLGFSKFDEEGRYLELKYPQFALINLYIPHGGRDKSKLDYKLKVYELLIKKLSNSSASLGTSQKTNPLILCGDFNVAHEEIDLARPKDNFNNIMFTQDERKCVDKLIFLGLIDSFRELHKEGENYSWWPYRLDARERNLGWRIDYCFVSKYLQSKLKKAFILKDLKSSDHCPVGIDLNATQSLA
ncbi:exodeoxyribonuclease III [Candidatus Woesebacteria bacterium RBG_13_34_9]|uniref:Exodeoxyribonuclease III n=1 Tax=Candidatus Woesebacteria bacterium RBG_13_34_9 TaxID=1802477 RepID=A0A1F7X394_9BACT|nr:MAG: exodeoxyribonuclease III [Candidatus Woesebacteria bacterium RBG_13_34_9]